MASTASFFTIPKVGAALLGNAETNLQVPTTTSDILTGGGSGTQIYELRVQAAGAGTTVTTVAGEVYLFLFDNTTNHLFDVIPVTVVVGNTTTAPFFFKNIYNNLFLPSATWKLRASQSIAGNASLLKVTAFALDA